MSLRSYKKRHTQAYAVYVYSIATCLQRSKNPEMTPTSCICTSILIIYYEYRIIIVSQQGVNTKSNSLSAVFIMTQRLKEVLINLNFFVVITVMSQKMAPSFKLPQALLWCPQTWHHCFSEAA